MNWCRWVGVWSAGLFWLTAGVGCSNVVDSDAKWGKAKSTVESESKIEMDSADKTQAGEAETIVIPLDQIWAYGMPGTRDVLSLDRDQIPQQPLGIRVGGPPSFMSHQGKEIAGPGFAVLGTGMEAWLATHAKLPEGQKPRDSFPFGSEVSVVFFSHGFNYYVHIHRVERQGNVITIRYRFVPHETKNLSSHFAIIPVDELRPGKVHVNIIRTPMEKKYVDVGFKPVSAEWERRVVCKSFSFSISERK